MARHVAHAHAHAKGRWVLTAAEKCVQTRQTRRCLVVSCNVVHGNRSFVHGPRVAMVDDATSRWRQRRRVVLCVGMGSVKPIVSCVVGGQGAVAMFSTTRT